MVFSVEQEASKSTMSWSCTGIRTVGVSSFAAKQTKQPLSANSSTRGFSQHTVNKNKNNDDAKADENNLSLLNSSTSVPHEQQSILDNSEFQHILDSDDDQIALMLGSSSPSLQALAKVMLRDKILTERIVYHMQQLKIFEKLDDVSKKANQKLEKEKELAQESSFLGNVMQNPMYLSMTHTTNIHKMISKRSTVSKLLKIPIFCKASDYVVNDVIPTVGSMVKTLTLIFKETLKQITVLFSSYFGSAEKSYSSVEYPSGSYKGFAVMSLGLCVAFIMFKYLKEKNINLAEPFMVSAIGFFKRLTH